MASYNKVVLVGNVTRDPELRYTPSSMAVIDIGLAVNDRRKGPNGDWIDETTFVDITLWGRTAEIAGEYLKKGTNTLIEGRLKLDSWQDKDGQKRSKLKVVGEKLVLLGGRPEGGGGGGGGRGASRGGGAPQYDESEYNPANDFDAPQASRSGGAQGGGGSAGGDDDIPF